MIVGECPYCDGQISTPIAPKCPAYSKERCPGCSKEYWLRHSRVDPEAYPLEAATMSEDGKVYFHKG